MNNREKFRNMVKNRPRVLGSVKDKIKSRGLASLSKFKNKQADNQAIEEPEEIEEPFMWILSKSPYEKSSFVLEYQRCQNFDWSTKNLLEDDPGPYVHNNTTVSNFDSLYFDPPPGWTWRGDWEVDMTWNEDDEEGFKYGSHFLPLDVEWSGETEESEEENEEEEEEGEFTTTTITSTTPTRSPEVCVRIRRWERVMVVEEEVRESIVYENSPRKLEDEQKDINEEEDEMGDSKLIEEEEEKESGFTPQPEKKQQHERDHSLNIAFHEDIQDLLLSDEEDEDDELETLMGEDELEDMESDDGFSSKKGYSSRPISKKFFSMFGDEDEDNEEEDMLGDDDEEEEDDEGMFGGWKRPKVVKLKDPQLVAIGKQLDEMEKICKKNERDELKEFSKVHQGAYKEHISALEEGLG